jgi:hypothetical protein
MTANAAAPQRPGFGYSGICMMFSLSDEAQFSLSSKFNIARTSRLFHFYLGSGSIYSGGEFPYLVNIR